jgi:hypothetical protein
MSAAVGGAALVLTMILAGACYRQWRRNQALQAQLQATAADLEHLQLACSRLAPAGVVQQLVADGTRDATLAAAEHKIATALFVDLVGFTELSAPVGPAFSLFQMQPQHDQTKGTRLSWSAFSLFQMQLSPAYSLFQMQLIRRCLCSKCNRCSLCSKCNRRSLCSKCNW